MLVSRVFGLMMPTLLTGVGQRSVRLLSSIRSKSCKPLRVAFLGAGDISNLHAEAINRTASAELTGITSHAAIPLLTHAPSHHQSMRPML